jgi:CheY-like chemotaxis protein
MDSQTPPRHAGSDLTGVPILIVEDDPAGARLLAVLLGRAGGEVRVAHSAEEALAILRVFQPRVVVVDLILPGMSGLQFVQRLKLDPSTRDIVVIAVSVVNGRETQQLALESGCAEYISKPIDVDSFVQTVHKHVKATA